MSSFRTTGKKIVAIGRNYAAHAHELGNEIPKAPFFFLKPTSSYSLRSNKVEIPTNVLVHHEVELGVIIGKNARDVSPSEAMKHVAGYALAIDYTARNVQDAAKAKGLPWSAAKGFDTFCPVGDFIDAKDIKDPHNLNLWYKINGELKQNDSTGLMLVRIPELIAHCSSILTLEEGDLLLTGTPEGVGPIKVGDKITAGLQQDGKDIATLAHEAIARQGGYTFKK